MAVLREDGRFCRSMISPIGSDAMAAGTIRYSGPPPLTRGLVV